MEDQLWDLFRETGDPIGYLLYKAEKKRKAEKSASPERSEAERRGAKPPEGTPPASV